MSPFNEQQSDNPVLSLYTPAVSGILHIIIINVFDEFYQMIQLSEKRDIQRKNKEARVNIIFDSRGE